MTIDERDLGRLGDAGAVEDLEESPELELDQGDEAEEPRRAPRPARPRATASSPPADLLTSAEIGARLGVSKIWAGLNCTMRGCGAGGRALYSLTAARLILERAQKRRPAADEKETTMETMTEAEAARALGTATNAGARGALWRAGIKLVDGRGSGYPAAAVRELAAKRGQRDVKPEKAPAPRRPKRPASPPRAARSARPARPAPPEAPGQPAPRRLLRRPRQRPVTAPPLLQRRLPRPTTSSSAGRSRPCSSSTARASSRPRPSSAWSRSSSACRW